MLDIRLLMNHIINPDVYPVDQLSGDITEDSNTIAMKNVIDIGRGILNNALF